MRTRCWLGSTLIVAVSLMLVSTAPRTSRGQPPEHSPRSTGQTDNPRATYNRTGAALVSALANFSKSLANGDATGLKSALSPNFTATLGRRPKVAPGFGVGVWEAQTEALDADGAIGELLAWNATFAHLDRAKVKLVSLDDVAAGRATARFELGGTGHGGERITDRGNWSLTFETYDSDGDTPDRDIRLTRIDFLSGETVFGSGATRFKSRAVAAGIDSVGVEDPRFQPPSDRLQFQTSRHSVGAAVVGDIDGDGADDVLLGSGQRVRLFRNRGDGTFTDHTRQAGLEDVRGASVALFADFDNDGDQDLFIGKFFGSNQLFSNDGKGRFTDVTASSGLGADDQVASVAALDADGDGVLDLYLGRFLDSSKTVPDMIHYSRNGQPNRLYRGRGDLTFDDVSAGSGADDRGLTLAIAAADYDRDGDQDLYLANDFGRNVLLANRGDGTFEDVALKAGAAAISAGMGTSFGDYDGDGWLDIYVSGIRSNQRWFSNAANVRAYVMQLVASERRTSVQSTFLDLRRILGDSWDQVGQRALAGNYLLRNKGDGTFEDVSESLNARPSGWYWGSGFVDVDNDGDLDIYAVNGWITGASKHDL